MSTFLSLVQVDSTAETASNRLSAVLRFQGPPPSPGAVVRRLRKASAESLAQRMDLSGWGHGHCPLCGWEPDFAVITPNVNAANLASRSAHSRGS